MDLEGMEGLEEFLMGEGQGSMELDCCFNSDLDARWNDLISESDGNGLDLFPPLEEDGQAPLQHPPSACSKHQNEDDFLQLVPLQEEGGGEGENGFLEPPDGFDSEFISFLEEDGSTLAPSSSFCSMNQMEQPQTVLQEKSNDEDEDEDEEEGSESDDKKGNAPNSKNLVSERNRRKRLNQQLFTLRSLVPNITKMDKRSILVDALAYLQSILRAIEKEKENANISSDSSRDDSSRAMDEEIQPMQPQEYVRCDSSPAISKIALETLDEESFVVEIGCNRAMGALSQAQRIFESLGMEIISNSIHQLDHDYLLTTAFLRTKKKGVVTEEKLRNRANKLAMNLGLRLPNSLVP